jgi:hypothetical protein
MNPAAIAEKAKIHARRELRDITYDLSREAMATYTAGVK